MYSAEKTRRNFVDSSKMTKNISWSTLITALLALIFAFIAMIFSINDYIDDRAWK